MSWYNDHMNSVAGRWSKKYQESWMSCEKFSKFMRKTMIEYGWTEDEADKLVFRAVGRAKK